MPVIIPSGPTTGQLGPLGAITSVSYNGWVTGAGTPWHLQDIKGWDDMPDINVGDTILSGLDGVAYGLDTESKRVIELTVIAYGNSTQGRRYQQDQLSTYIQEMVSSVQRLTTGTLPLVVTYTNADGVDTSFTANVRPRKRVVKRNYQQDQIASVCTVTFEAADPRIYAGAGPQIQTTGMAQGAGGRSYPRAYPWNYGTLGSGGIIVCNNTGTTPSYPLALIAGPCVNPVVSLVGYNMHVRCGINLASTDILQLDFAARTILLSSGGGAPSSRYYTITADSDWFSLPSGETQVQYSADFFEATSTLTLNWQPAVA